MSVELGLRPTHPVAQPLSVIAEVVGAPCYAWPLVSGITHDSRAVRPGDLYAAMPGAHVHGATFAHAVKAAGAVAMLTDAEGAALAADTDLPMLIVQSPRAVLGAASAAVYGYPANDLLLFGITGTNGKTTTSYLLDSALRAAGHRTGLIGTVETRIGRERVHSVRTTPEATDLHAIFAVMRESGVTACTMEVSSHALVMGRVGGVTYDVAGFTNLSQDHLDFHGDMAHYFAAKTSLFEYGRSRHGVVVIDDEWGEALLDLSHTPTEAVSTTGRRRTSGSHPCWRAHDRVAQPGGSTVTLADPSGVEASLWVGLPGQFNVANACLAVAMAVAAGVTREVAQVGVSAADGVPGRMQVIRVPGAPLAVVDYAHTPDAVGLALSTLREHSGKGRLIVVLGAGGDRDEAKRERMGSIAGHLADIVFVTDDNPRSEDPAAIRAAMLDGAHQGSAEIHEVADRSAAINAACQLSIGDDIVLVAGKGHETGQEIAGVVHPFDDRQVLHRALSAVVAARAGRVKKQREARRD